MKNRLGGLAVALALFLCTETVYATPISDFLVVVDPTRPNLQFKRQCTEGNNDIDNGCPFDLVVDVDPTKIESPVVSQCSAEASDPRRESVV